MSRYAALFLVLGFIAAVFGFNNIAGDAAWFVKALFFIFLVLFVVSLVAGSFRRGP